MKSLHIETVRFERRDQSNARRYPVHFDLSGGAPLPGCPGRTPAGVATTASVAGSRTARCRGRSGLVVLALGLALSAASAQAASLGPAVLCSGAARLYNGSVVTLGQPLVGVAGGGGLTLSVGVLPAIGATTNPPAAPQLGTMTLHPGGAFGFTFLTEAGRHYVVETSTNLMPFSWVPLETVPGTGGPLPFLDPRATNHPQRFYRVTTQ